MTATTKLTTDDIERAYGDERWLGWGYLGARRTNEINEGKRNVADAVVLDHANEEGWTTEQLFQWLNSRPGRHYGDLAFGGYGSLIKGDLAAEALRVGLLDEVREGD